MSISGRGLLLVAQPPAGNQCGAAEHPGPSLKSFLPSQRNPVTLASVPVIGVVCASVRMKKVVQVPPLEMGTC